MSATLIFEDYPTDNSDQARVAVEYQTIDDTLGSNFQLIHVDRRWLREKMILRSRKENDIATWYTTDLGPAPPAAPLPIQSLPTRLVAEHPSITRKISQNIVEVHACTPYKTSGAYNPYMQCGGLVINAEQGFVVTAGSFMPSMCILHVVFADSIEVPAKKVYDHALGFTVIQYNTSLVKGSLESITLYPIVPKVGQKLTIYGHNRKSFPSLDQATVTSIGPLTGEYNCGHSYHPVNMDVLHFEADESGGAGVLLDQNGDFQGLWLPFFVNQIKWAGVPLSLLLPALKMLQKGSLPSECRMLDAELGVVDKNDARVFGVSEGTTLLPSSRAFTDAF